MTGYAVIRPPQIWRSDSEKVMVLSSDHHGIRVHYSERGPVEEGHVELFDEADFRKRFIFVEDVRIKLSNLAPGWTVHTTLPTNHPIHSLVGQVVAKWSEVDHALDRAIWSLAKLDDHTGTCLTAQIQHTGGKIAAVVALCHRRGIDQQLIKKLNKQSDHIHACTTRRNRVVHDPWFIEEPNEQTKQLKGMAKNENKYGYYPIDEAYLDDTLKMMESCIKNTNVCLQAIADAAK